MWRADQCVVVPNGIDTERFVPGDREQARAKLGTSGESKVILCVARLSPEKGIDVAIQALGRVEGATLWIAGDGPERRTLENAAQAAGLTARVRFLGIRIDLPQLLPAADAVWVPSRTEAHGLVAAEAMACQVPVIASAAGGLKSLIADGVTGLAVPPGDAAALAAATRCLFSDDPLARRLAAAGRAHVCGHYSLATMLEQTERVYRQLCEPGTRNA
jgi:glycosyltransferase involved in cell wall biosynthesis